MPFRRLLKSQKAKNVAPVKALRTIDDKINAESELGRTIFGPIPEGHQREFFEHKKNLWVWYEAWSEGGKDHQITFRYEVRPNGVYKMNGNVSYVKIEGQELANFRAATKKYLELIKTRLYSA